MQGIKEWEFIKDWILEKLTRFVWKKLRECKALLCSIIFHRRITSNVVGIFDMLFPFAAFFKLYPIICNILGKLWSRDPSCKGPIWWLTRRVGSWVEGYYILTKNFDCAPVSRSWHTGAFANIDYKLCCSSQKSFEVERKGTNMETRVENMMCRRIVLFNFEAFGNM